MTDRPGNPMQALQMKLSEVTQTKGLRDAIAVEQSADPLDTTQRALEREMATVSRSERNAGSPDSSCDLSHQSGRIRSMSRVRGTDFTEAACCSTVGGAMHPLSATG